MSKRKLEQPQQLEPRLVDELAEVAEDAHCELIHAEYKGGVLRLVLDRPEGITHADCEAVSKQASAILDVEDFGHGRYILEVSSPGLDRELYRAEDYERFLGRTIRVTYSTPDDEARRTVVGKLDRFDRQGEETATVVDSETGDQHIIPLKTIKLARLVVEL